MTRAVIRDGKSAASFLRFAFFVFACSIGARSSLIFAEDIRQSTASIVRLQAVDQLLQEHVDQKKISGATAVILKNNVTLHRSAYGLSDVDQKIEMKIDSLFRIASMTKPITSVAIMMLVEDGHINLQDPLEKFVPDFKDVRVMDSRDSIINTHPVNRPITVHDLLTHTSGFTYASSVPALVNEYRRNAICEGLIESTFNLEENMKRLSKLPIVQQPGSHWHYGMSTDVLGRIVEVASQKTLEEFFAERIFTPLSMEDTYFHLPNSKVDRLAKLYRSDKANGIAEVPSAPQIDSALPHSTTFQFPDATKYYSGGAGLVSSADDYAKFLTMLFNNGAIGDKQLLTPESVHLMTTNQIGKLKIGFVIHGDKFGYGFGIHQDTAERHGSAAGTYSWAGMFYSYFWVDPQEKIVAVLMTQLHPAEGVNLWADFQRTVNEAVKSTAP